MNDKLAREAGQVLRWADGANPAFEVVADARVLALERSAWAAAAAHLEPGAGDSYRDLGRSGDFGPWWQSAVGGWQPGIRRFRLQLPPPVWQRPWEAMIGALDSPRWAQVSIIRQTASDTARNQPSQLDAALSILRIEGAPTLGADTLALDLEMRRLTDAHALLDFNAARAVAPPVSEKGRVDTLCSTIVTHRPTVLWFSGHARADPPGLLLDDGHWLTPEELAEILRKAKALGARTPTYAVLWACRTGSARAFTAPTPAPAFVEALSAEGVVALLVTQALLADDVAGYVASEIFRALAAGRPIDHGVTLARAALMHRAQDAQMLWNDIDWMCPVVWSKGYPPPALQWADHREEAVRRQGLAEKTLPARLTNVMDRSVAAAVQAWPDERRLWVASGAPHAEAPRTLWARRALAVQQATAHTVLWFDFLSGPAAPVHAVLQLQDWAKRILDVVDADDDSTGMVREIAEQMQLDPESAWRGLCAREELVLAIMEPPDQSEEWFWSALREGAARAVVLAEDYPDKRVEEWSVDALTEYPEPLEKSKTLSAIALLGYPAARRDIDDAAGQSIDRWIQQGVVLETGAGCVMPAGLAEKIVRTLTPQEALEGHGLAYDFLSGAVARRKLGERTQEALLLARWRHARFAESTPAIHADGQNLLRLYSRQHRSAAFLDVLSSLQGADWNPPGDIVVAAAWAYISRGQPLAAIAWLESEPEDDSADWLAALAEAEKSSGAAGSKARARQHLDKALSILDLEEGEDAKIARLRVRHEIARLVQFFGAGSAAAIPLYEDIEREWEGIANSDLARAVTLRNFAEALMHEARLDDAGRRLRQARDLIPEWTQHNVVGEIEYLEGRIAVRRGLDERDIVRCFELCRTKALHTNHMMLAAIVDARLFWLGKDQQDAESFDDAPWTEHAAKLRLFERHAWCARVLINGCLRAARRFGQQGYRGKALAQLLEARRLLDANPSFDRGRDRTRIAVLRAGLTIYDVDGKVQWDEWRRECDWATGFSADPAEVWKLEV